MLLLWYRERSRTATSLASGTCTHYHEHPSTPSHGGTVILPSLHQAWQSPYHQLFRDDRSRGQIEPRKRADGTGRAVHPPPRGFGLLSACCVPSSGRDATHQYDNTAPLGPASSSTRYSISQLLVLRPRHDECEVRCSRSNNLERLWTTTERAHISV